ncbi:hypothetical protein Pmani_009141 [Petrolisthes manimaculis]|uniref:Uncharacterized protein n=1 Tax=Petrolisthes manimaculis TaxID=1843537 RepID=A0AAE1UIP3_9EUCA|nr:hypothetical protein Pmani_009141 [Petrolisthes manimaculis]
MTQVGRQASGLSTNTALWEVVVVVVVVEVVLGPAPCWPAAAIMSSRLPLWSAPQSHMHSLYVYKLIHTLLLYTHQHTLWSVPSHTCTLLTLHSPTHSVVCIQSHSIRLYAHPHTVLALHSPTHFKHTTNTQ